MSTDYNDPVQKASTSLGDQLHLKEINYTVSVT